MSEINAWEAQSKSLIEVQKKGRSFAKDILGRAPRSGRKSSTLFVPVGEDSKKVFDRAMATGLNRLGRGKPRGITLHKGTNLGKELEGIIDEAAKANGKIPPNIAKKTFREHALRG